LTIAFSSTSLIKRVPSFFCCSISSSTCLGDNKPSSTRASAIRSPNDLTGGMRLTEGFADVFDEVVGRHQEPEQPVGGGFGQFLGGLLVEWICRGHHHRFAHPVEGQHAPASACFGREAPRQIQVEVITIKRKKSHPRAVGQNL